MADEPVDEELPERRLPTALSPTSIETYMGCPRRFEWEKVDRHPPTPAGPEAVLGSYVHAVLELLLQLEPEKRTRAAARVIMRELFPLYSAEQEFIDLGLDEGAERTFRWSAWKSLLTYFTMEDPMHVVVISTEQNILAEIDGVPTRGIVDRIETGLMGALVVTDYKNGKVPDERYMGPKVRQLNLYAALVEAGTEMARPDYGRLLFTAHGKEIEVPFTVRSVEKAVGEARHVWDSMQVDFDGGEFKPKRQALCGWCPAILGCPEGQAEVISRGKKKPGSRGSLGSHSPAWDVVPELVEIRRSRLDLTETP